MMVRNGREAPLCIIIIPLGVHSVYDYDLKQLDFLLVVKLDFVRR